MSEKKDTYWSTGEVDWDDAGSGNSGGGGGGGGGGFGDNLKKMKLPEDTKVKFRVVGKPYQYLEHFRPICARSPGEDEDIAWREGGYKPARRYALLVIDRGETNPKEKFKLLDCGVTFINWFKGFRKLSGKNPGGPDSPDFVCVKTTPKKNGKPSYRDTQYAIMADGDSAPFTDDELEEIERLSDPKKHWSSQRSPMSAEYIEKLYKVYIEDPDSKLVPGSYDYNMKLKEERKSSEKSEGNFRNAHTSDIDDNGDNGTTPPSTPSTPSTSYEDDSPSHSSTDSKEEFDDMFNDESADQAGGLF